jgi:dephospho-CoA kinase
LAGLLRVGLTGGIACGRSTIARFLEERDRWLLLDADRISHSLTGPGGGAVEEIVRELGEEYRGPDGGIDRAALGRLVFADPGARARLEGILHPMILEAVERAAAAFAGKGGDGVLMVDAALMVETGSFRRYHRLVVAHCPRRIQKERLRRRDGLGDEEADRRIASQAPTERKMALADYLIDTGGSLEETRRHTLEVAALLEEDQRLLPDLPPRRRKERT